MNRQRGSVLFITLLVMIVVSLLGLAFMGTALTENTVASNWQNQTQAFYTAEGGVEWGVSKLKVLLQGATPPTDGDLTGIALPTVSDGNFSIKEFTVWRARPPYNTVVDSGPFRSLNARVTDYQVTTEVTGPRGSRSRQNQIIQYLEIPLFQFMGFYGRGIDFETYAGPEFWLKGRVHANSNIYIGDNASNGLHFDSFVTATGNFYRKRKDRSGTVREGNPDIATPGVIPAPYLDFDHEVKNISSDGSTWTPSDESYWQQTALDRFKGRLLDRAHGVPEIIPPVPDLFNNPSNPDVVAHQMIEKGTGSDNAEMKAAKLYYQAGLRIAVDASGNATATRKDGSSVSLPAGIVSTSPSFYDDREKRTINLTQVDVAALRANLSTLFPSTPFNGILYVSTGVSDGAVRLVSGSQLPSLGGGFTVISENPVYIRGDYNTQNKVPAAVLADAITVLSNNWEPNNSDAKGNADFHTRPATATTVNAALATGPNVESSPDHGNGEFNNLIRFLENWRDITITYRGSVIALWHSQKATGAWCCGTQPGTHYYDAPIRDWAYDTLFDTSQPPGAPKGIVIARGRWWQE